MISTDIPQELTPEIPYKDKGPFENVDSQENLNKVIDDLLKS